MNKVYTLAAIAILLLLLGAVIGWSIAGQHCDLSRESPPPITRTSSHPDSVSVPIVVRSPSFKMNTHANSHLIDHVNLKDATGDSASVDSAMHRVACLDTLVSTPSARAPDTLYICYDPPADSFAIDLRFAERDTAVQVRYLTHDSIIEHTQVIAADRKAWYVEPLEILGSIVFGFLLGRR